MSTPELTRHPLSAAFGDIGANDEADYEEFLETFRQNGQAHAIMVHDGMILDGWNRYRACLDLGIEPRFKELNVPEGLSEQELKEFLVDVVIVQNTARRHQTTGQRAMAALEMEKYIGKDAARKKANVSHETFRRANIVANESPPEVVELIKAGKKTVAQAFEEQRGPIPGAGRKKGNPQAIKTMKGVSFLRPLIDDELAEIAGTYITEKDAKLIEDAIRYLREVVHVHRENQSSRAAASA